ncbi:hypothetical protein PR202_ga04602 [Eleusine coracana subsp. coracana]|uniref:PsbP C-terminal domain-containing protein n=1 Tax=Eleusine coracana subsp. coracana TaxID=191504 RepID=A0AAV5BQA1_ELECO|nr:hypothetical protein PR202_ga04602 [Eleusine coracana subsp. coracana]
MAPAALLPLAPSPPHPSPPRRIHCRCGASRRGFTIHTAIAIASTSATAARAGAAAAADELPAPSPQPPPPPTPAPKPGGSMLGGLVNTRSWPQHYGSGFSIRVPPSFEDILEPEDYNAGMTYYGDKAKPRAYEARFASPDRVAFLLNVSHVLNLECSAALLCRDELVSVVIKPSNQLKITFLEAKDITDLGTLKEASKIFVPAGAKVYAARTIKVKDEEDIRTYYFYEFGLNKQHVALMATVNSGKTYIAAATAPQAKWDDDSVKLRSAAVSLTLS